MYGTVEAVAWLTPSMVRVTLGGPGLDGFEPSTATDQYVVCAFGEDDRPVRRRLTVRSWDASTRTMAIDVVVHGDVGHAGRWAQHARPGDVLSLGGPGGGYRPDPDAPWHLLVGDESALPAIGASLEVLPAGRRCIAVLVTDSADHELELRTAADLDVRWVHRHAGSPAGEALVHAVAALDWPGGRPDVFVHGEAGEVRAVRAHLLRDRGVDPSTASISPYWRRGYDDDAWRTVKRRWLEDQEGDV